jgi:diacylglycerol kinase (ATP)
VVNPRAGAGRSRARLEGAESLRADFDLVEIGAQGAEATRAALEGEPAEDCAGVVVFGGDGTVNGLLPLLAARALPLALFPAGTVNDLARELGLTASWADLRALVLRGRPEPMDLVSVNGRPFAVYASLGMGAENSKFMHRTRRLFGALRRRLPMLMMPLFLVRTIVLDTRYRRRLRVELDGSARELATPGIYVANQAHLSGNLDLGWRRAADDHRFLAVTLADLGRVGLLRLVYALQTSRRLSAAGERLEARPGQRLVIESMDGEPISAFGDGEPLVDAPRLEFEVLPGAIQVYRGHGTA